MKRWTLYVLAAALLAALPASSIIIRHDREDARYLALGAKYPAVCFTVPDGEGTLIAPQWVLTAAHVAHDSGDRVRFDYGAEYRVESKTLHEAWRDGGPHDIALLKLSEPVRGVVPVALYETADEAGQTVTFVGRGDTGTGLTGPKSADKKKRAATNVVDSADANWLRFTFDEPPAGTDLEGVSGPGDSGGPALIEKNGRLYVAGVSVFGSDGKHGPSSYGTREGYTRVSTHLDWIRGVMQGTITGRAAAPPAKQAQRPAPIPAGPASPRPAAVTVPPGAPPALPDTPAGKRLAAWLPVINQGDAEGIAAFVRANFAKSALERRSAEERAQTHQDFFAETGGLNVRAVRDLGAHEVEITAQAVKTGAWFSVGLRVEPEAPNGILGFRFDESGPPPPPVPTGKLAPPQIAQDIEAFAAERAGRDEFSGAVLLAKDGQPLLEKAWGRASIRYNVPNRADTKFNLGSMNKMFTAVAIAQLAEHGKLSFDDKVGKHLPDYPNEAVRGKVTIHQLLTHTSGLGSYFNSKKYEEGWIRIRTVDDFLGTFVDAPLEFEPGARFQYSNSGFIVLGKIIEKISGMSYYDYVREKIFKPAGMTSTDSYEMDREEANLATGYTNFNPATDRPEQGPRRNNYFSHSVKGGPAGGGFSTVGDLFRFDQALRSHKLLSAKMAELVITGKAEMGGPGGNTKYAYGFGDTRAGNERIHGHTGGAPGINSSLEMFWTSGWTVAVMSNYDRGAMPIAQRARQLILQQ